MITSAEHFNKAIALWFDITGITRQGGRNRSQVYHNNWRTDEYIKEAKHD